MNQFHLTDTITDKDMNKNTIIVLIIIGIVILGAGFLVFYKKGDTVPEASGIVLFYGDGCSHCKNVEDFIVNNSVEEKVKFERKEVFNNTDNASLLLKTGELCKISKEYIGGVPLLWDGPNKTCVFGDVDIIKFFQDKINLINNT